ncbi:MAG: endonuclease/exonuclease/phosphatase family protein [Omnitrophica WOR_2 bacterium]
MNKRLFNMKFILEVLLYLWAAGAAFVCLGTLAAFWSRRWWFYDMIANFRMQFFIILGISALVFLLFKRPVPAGSFFMFALINLVVIAPAYLIAKPPQSNRKTFRLVSANVLQLNTNYEKTRQFIETTQPDLIVLIETNREWIDRLNLQELGYPYTNQALQENYYGIALYSRVPFDRAQIQYFSTPFAPSAVVWLQLDGKPVTLIGTHFPSPKGGRWVEYRNQQFVNLEKFVAEQTGDILISGDMNTTSWSPYFQDFLKASGLQDSRQGFGLQASWPVGQPFWRIPIDHILISPGIQVQNRRLGPNIGSDHFPVILDFTIQP